MMQLKKYQENAIRRLFNDSCEALGDERESKIVFKAPTGSGKTIMMAEFLKRLKEKESYSLSFIWTAPRKLHNQSKKKLEKYYQDSISPECVNFQDLTDKWIRKYQILFLNWESINRKDNNLITRENENDFYLDKIIENTRDKGQRIVLIIDESHHHATSKISQDLIRDIDPDLLIEVSATPILENFNGLVPVEFEHVQNEGMIKKSINFNHGFDNILDSGKLQSELANGSQEMIIDIALKKRQELISAYKAEGSDINPLVLIQLPDRGTPQGDRAQDEVESTLQRKYNITIENMKLARYLSENKKNLENIQKNDNETEVLIFKQAIALGWDCPRAHILVLLRDLGSEIFSIQIIGRIMRMPEPDLGYYQNDVLNHAYVFTNHENMTIKEDIAPSYITINTSKRIESYKPISLESSHRRRHREKTRLSPLFTDMFLQEAIKYKLETKIDMEEVDIEANLLNNFTERNVDNLANKTLSSDISFNSTNKLEMQNIFEGFIVEHLTPFYPEDRTMGRVKTAIYNFFDLRLSIKFTDDLEKIIKIVLNPDNKRYFIEVIERTKEEYIKETKKREPELPEETWGIPEQLNFNGDCAEIKVKKSVMQPFFCRGDWNTEKAFIDVLEQSRKVEWWFQNGSRDKIFFAIPYFKNDDKKPFYLDFIVQFKDGKIGLFDTKSGRTIDDAKEKNYGLRYYIDNLDNVWGGLVTNPDTKEFERRWLIYKGTGMKLDSEDLDNWEELDI